MIIRATISFVVTLIFRCGMAIELIKCSDFWDESPLCLFLLLDGTTCSIYCCFLK
jgi:hypothetical protein